MELTVRNSVVGGQLVLTVAGEIDLATVPQLHSALHRAMHGHTLVIVDLDGVYACDDTGLGVLLGAAGRAREAGGDIAVVCSAGAIRSRLERTGFDRAVVVVESIAAAASANTANNANTAAAAAMKTTKHAPPTR